MIHTIIERMIKNGLEKAIKRGDKEKEKENIELKEDLEVMREDVKEFKKTGIFGHWRDYRRYWADKSYTIEISDASETLRVKFYRAKDIYERLSNKFLEVQNLLFQI